MIYTYKITKSDMLDSIKLNIKFLGNKWLVAFQYIGIPLWAFFDAGADVDPFLNAIFMFFMVVYIRKLTFYYHSKTAKEHLKNHPSTDKNILFEVILRNDAIEMHKYNDGLLEYKDIMMWAANGAVTLIYKTPQIYYIFPRRLEEQGFDFESFHSILRDKIGPQGKKNIRTEA